MNFKDIARDFDKWPSSWMRTEEDLEYGKKLLPYFEEFLNDMARQDLSRKTMKNYIDSAWLLGGTIITNLSFYEDYGAEPLKKLMKSVESDGVLPDGFDGMSESDLRLFERMCRRFEKFLISRYAR